jgi:predicted hydrocarbon binding protein
LVSKDKKLIAVPGDLLEKIYAVSAKEGKTPFLYISEIFEQALRAHDIGKSLRQVIDAYIMIETVKNSGSTIISSESLYTIIQKIYGDGSDELRRKWFETGEWYGKYILAKFGELKNPEELKNLIEAYLWDMNEIHLVRIEDKAVLKCISPHQPLELTELSASFLEGVMSALGYKCVRKDVVKGVILMEFKI